MFQSIIINVFLLLISYHSLKAYIKKYIRDEIISFQLYRSVICTFIALYSTIQILINWDKFWNTPTKYVDKHTEWINILTLSYFISDIFTMICQKNKRIDLWIHHIFCLISLSLHSIYYSNPCIILNGVIMAEFMSAVSGLDAVAKYFKYGNILWWTKLYRCFVIILIRFPIWIMLIKFVLTTDMYYAAQVNCIVGSITMCSLDIYWLRLCIKALRTHIY